MIKESKDKMMRAEDAIEKQLFHFAGDGIWHAKAIYAATIEEAEKLWHATKIPIVKASIEPAASPPAAAAPADEKVEAHKSTDETI